jgi:hypothetical protein
MKNFFYLLPIIIVALGGCNGKTSATLNSTSGNGKVKVTITGTRGNVFDPFKTEIAVKAYDFKEGKLSFEIMADDLNDKNVKFAWTDDNNCVISIEENDKHVRSFQLIASESQVQLAEI